MSDIVHAMDLAIRRLRQQAPLTDEDVDAIRALSGEVRTLNPASYLVREGEVPRICTFLLEGFAYRQKLASDGARQIVALHIPGEALDFQSLYLAHADHNVQTLSRATVLTVPRGEVQALIARSPTFAHAVILNILTEASIMREWVLNIGRRDARTRLAHLLCEFALRMDGQGLTGAAGYELPMTQEQLGDALGLTSVHVNRTLKVLEGEGVLTRQGRRIRFWDWEQMRRIADFSALYLHLDVATVSADRDRPGADVQSQRAS